MQTRKNQWNIRLQILTLSALYFLFLKKIYTLPPKLFSLLVILAKSFFDLYLNKSGSVFSKFIQTAYCFLNWFTVNKNISNFFFFFLDKTNHTECVFIFGKVHISKFSIFHMVIFFRIFFSDHHISDIFIYHSLISSFFMFFLFGIFANFFHFYHMCYW